MFQPRVGSSCRGLSVESIACSVTVSPVMTVVLLIAEAMSLFHPGCSGLVTIW